MKQAIIIGSGIAGLAAALRVKKMGYTVTVFEANEYPGGKIHTIESNGFRFDTGPSLFTMPHLVDDLFKIYNQDPRQYFNYHQKEIICNYFWEDGQSFSVSRDIKKFVKEACQEFQVTEKKLNNYLSRSKKKYDATSSIFLEKSLHKISTYISTSTLQALFKAHHLDLNQSLHETNVAAFDDPKLIQLFDRYATYNGSSPYKTPGIMSMIPHLEMHYGTYFPKGGMKAITTSLYNFAKDQGVQFNFNEEVLKIDTIKKKVVGITSVKKSYNADVVISNADVFTSYKHLLKGHVQPKKILEQERSSSAVIFYWGINKVFPELDLHNILFTKNYTKEFLHIFEKSTLCDDLTIYINITSKEEKKDAPVDCENWFVMINAPSNVDQNWDELVQKARKNSIDKINRVLKTNIAEHIVTEHILDPRTIESKTKSHKGALYGASSNSKFSAFLRHPNFTNKIKGLYFCGGSVHPGGGIPLCLLSSKIVTDIIQKESK